MIMNGYPTVTGEFLFRNQAAFPGLSAHGAADGSVEIWGPDGSAFPTLEEVVAWGAIPRKDDAAAAKEFKAAALARLQKLKGQKTDLQLDEIRSVLSSILEMLPG